MSKSKTVWATVGGVLSSFLALLGVVGCCGLPILAGVLSFIGIGASQLSFFAEYRGWFIGFAIICLLFGFWQVYFRKPKKSCCSTGEEQAESCCSAPPKEPSGCGCGNDSEQPGKPKSQRTQKIILWIGAILVVLMLLLGVEEKQNNTAIEGACCPPQTETIKQSGCCPEPETQPTSCCPSE